MQLDIGNNPIQTSARIFSNTNLNALKRDWERGSSPDEQHRTHKDRRRHGENYLSKRGRNEELLFSSSHPLHRIDRPYQSLHEQGVMSGHDFVLGAPQNGFVGAEEPPHPKTPSRGVKKNAEAAPPPLPRNGEGGEEAAVGGEGPPLEEGKRGGEEEGRRPPKLAQTRVRPGMCIRSWIITSRIGAGSFGETFTAMKLHRLTSLDGYCEDRLYIPQDVDALLESLPPPEERKEVCIKIEQENKNILRLEALALKKVQSCPQVVRFISNGCADGMNYLVMEKLGPNLTELRRRSPHGTFNIYTTLKSGISCLMAIRGVHEQGLVHRDIKPSNFVTGLPGSPDRATCYLIDFGLARRYRRSNGELRPSRKNAGFRGTSRYASVASHQRLELGRVDDLWSLLFMLVEFATGTLPWRKYKDKEDIGRCKEESITPQLVRNLPREFQAFLAHLQSLVYEDEPDYDFLLSLMYRALARRGYPPNKPVDWELDPVTIEQVAEAEIRMSLHKRIDGNKLHTEKCGQNGGEGCGEIPNVEPNEGNIQPPLRCPAPLQPGEVVASPSAELVGTGMGDVIRGKPASSITGKSPSLEEAMVMGNGIHISEVELRYHQNGRGEEEHNVDAAAVSSTPGALAQSLREAGGVAWQEKMPECVPAANLKDAATARRDEAGGVGKETTPLWGKESPGGSLNVDGNVDPNDFSSRECSAGSNKHPILGKKGRRKGIEKTGDSLPKSLFKEIDHQGGVSHSVLALDLPPPRKVHIDAIQQTVPDTNNTSSSKPLNDESGLKKKVKKNCDCNIM